MKYLIIPMIAVLLAAVSAQAQNSGAYADSGRLTFPTSVQLPPSGQVSFQLGIDYDIYWENAYYLDNKQWKTLPLQGAPLMDTGWLHGPAAVRVDIPASSLADEDSIALLVFCCSRTTAGSWMCTKNSFVETSWVLV